MAERVGAVSPSAARLQPTLRGHVDNTPRPHTFPAMTQPRREALLDLLVLSIFADAHVSLKEDEALLAAIDSLGWESERPREIHFLNAMHRARAASGTAEAQSAFISKRAGLFDTPESRGAAVAAIDAVLSRDGVSPDESAFLAEVKKQLA